MIFERLLQVLEEQELVLVSAEPTNKSKANIIVTDDADVDAEADCAADCSADCIADCAADCTLDSAAYKS